MEITVTFRHVDPTPALKAYAEDKLARLAKKHLRRPVDAHVILSVAKLRHKAEITLTGDHGRLFAAEETGDLYSAIDLALEKVEHQAQKLKTKRGNRHKMGKASRGPRDVVASVVQRTERGAPEIIRAQRVPAKPMSVEEAVEQLDGSRAEFLVFTNASNQTLAVLYRRRDGNYGLIEPEVR